MRQSFCLSKCFIDTYIVTVEGESHASCLTNPAPTHKHMLQIHACLYYYDDDDDHQYYYCACKLHKAHFTLSFTFFGFCTQYKASSVCLVWLGITTNLTLPFHSEVESAVASTADWLRRMDGAQEHDGKCSPSFLCNLTRRVNTDYNFFFFFKLKKYY